MINLVLLISLHPFSETVALNASPRAHNVTPVHRVDMEPQDGPSPHVLLWQRIIYLSWDKADVIGSVKTVPPNRTTSCQELCRQNLREYSMDPSEIWRRTKARAAFQTGQTQPERDLRERKREKGKINAKS